jgi:hypothetical protein
MDDMDDSRQPKLAVSPRKQVTGQCTLRVPVTNEWLWITER